MGFNKLRFNQFKEGFLKGRNLLILFSSIFMVLLLLATGCTGTVPAATPTTPTATQTATPKPPTVATVTPSPVLQDKTYNFVNPQGSFIPVQTKALSPRLTTLDGMTIYVVQGEADAVIMPALIDKLKKDYPKTNWVFYSPSASFGITAPDDTMKKDAKGAIRGNGW
jgi:hypothetical protein